MDKKIDKKKACVYNGFVEVDYNKKGETFQNLLIKAFNTHLKAGSYSYGKGDASK